MASVPSIAMAPFKLSHLNMTTTKNVINVHCLALPVERGHCNNVETTTKMAGHLCPIRSNNFIDIVTQVSCSARHPLHQLCLQPMQMYYLFTLYRALQS